MKNDTKKMVLLFSHRLTMEQRDDAINRFGIQEFVSLNEKFQYLWSNVPADVETLDEYLEPIKSFLKDTLNQDDVVLIQGDFGATCHMAQFVKEIGAVGVYATTVRDVVEKQEGGVIIKTSIFKHVRFRIFG